MRRTVFTALIACALAAGCSAGGVPISEPERVEPLATAVPQSELEAIAWSIRDVVNAAVPSLLRAPPGPIMQQLGTPGTMTFVGTADQPSESEETLTLTVGYDGYAPRTKAAVLYTDWLLSSPSASAATLTIDFTDEPTPASKLLGFINGAFDGTIALARSKSPASADTVGARLKLQGQLAHDASGKVTWQGLYISGVVSSPSFGYYYNDARLPDANP